MPPGVDPELVNQAALINQANAQAAMENLNL